MPQVNVSLTRQDFPAEAADITGYSYQLSSGGSGGAGGPLSGSGAPGVGVSAPDGAVSGSFYVDTAAKKLYGPYNGTSTWGGPYVLSTALANMVELAFTAPPVAASWTSDNFDSFTHLEDFTSPVAGVRLRSDTNAYGATNNLRSALVAIPGAHWDVKARLRRHAALAQYQAFGLVFKDAAGGKFMTMGFGEHFGAGSASDTWSDANTSLDGVSLDGAALPWQHDVWMRATMDGTNCTFYFSNDGVRWALTKQFASSQVWGYLDNPATHIGFGYNSVNTTAAGLPQEVDLLSWSAVALS